MDRFYTPVPRTRSSASLNITTAKPPKPTGSVAVRPLEGLDIQIKS